MTRKEVLQTAEKMVCGHREQDYGSPEDNFKVIADFWSTYKGVEFSSTDVAKKTKVFNKLEELVAAIKAVRFSATEIKSLGSYDKCSRPGHSSLAEILSFCDINFAYNKVIDASEYYWPVSKIAYVTDAIMTSKGFNHKYYILIDVKDIQKYEKESK